MLARPTSGYRLAALPDDQPPYRPSDWLRVLLFGGLIVYHLGLMLRRVAALRGSRRAPGPTASRGRADVDPPWRCPCCCLDLGGAHQVRFLASWAPQARALNRTFSVLPRPAVRHPPDRAASRATPALIDSFGYRRRAIRPICSELFTNNHLGGLGGPGGTACPHYAHLWLWPILWTCARWPSALVLRFAPRAVAWAQARGLECWVKGPGLRRWPLVLLLLALRLHPVPDIRASPWS